jgi:hypothetical protein
LRQAAGHPFVTGATRRSEVPRGVDFSGAKFATQFSQDHLGRTNANNQLSAQRLVEGRQGVAEVGRSGWSDAGQQLGVNDEQGRYRTITLANGFAEGGIIGQSKITSKPKERCH